MNDPDKCEKTCRFKVVTLSDHAARQSGTLKRFRVGENGEGSAEFWAVPRHKALRTKNIVSTIFFTLPQHAGAP
jgi:hypothetical protein